MLPFQYLAYLDSKVIVDATIVVAKDLKTAELLAARSIPKKYEDQLDQIKVVVRPFDTNPAYHYHYYGYSYYYPYYSPYYYMTLNSSNTASSVLQNGNSAIGSNTSSTVTTSNTSQITEPNYSTVASILKSA
jgi:hypothetical protein